MREGITIENFCSIHVQYLFDIDFCIDFKRNYGQTAALQAGFDYANGKIIVAMDGDLQNDPSDIPKLLEKIVFAFILDTNNRVVDNVTRNKHFCK